MYVWIDSTIVLNWPTGNPRRFKTYVGNRVSYIVDLIDPDHWNHVSGPENPADCASRGLRASAPYISKEQRSCSLNWSSEKQSSIGLASSKSNISQMKSSNLLCFHFTPSLTLIIYFALVVNRRNLIALTPKHIL